MGVAWSDKLAPLRPPGPSTTSNTGPPLLLPLSAPHLALFFFIAFLFLSIMGCTVRICLLTVSSEGQVPEGKGFVLLTAQQELNVCAPPPNSDL